MSVLARRAPRDVGDARGPSGAPGPRGRHRRRARVLGAVVGAAVAFGLIGPAAPAGASPSLTRRPTPDNLPLAAISPRDGYRLVGADGAVFALGHQTFEGRAAGLLAPVTGAAPTPTANGYWLVSADGGVFAFGDAPFLGAVADRPLGSPVTAVASTRTGNGYWLASADGGVFAFGDATFAGALAGADLGAPVVDIAPTPTGLGYWLAAADGGVFAFGDAEYHGGLAGERLAGKVVGIAPTVTGDGYWLAASDGGVFALGDAPYLGGAGRERLNAPVIDISTTARGNGYWLAAGDGGVFAFGDATWRGSLQKRVPGGVVAVIGGMGWGPLMAPPPPDPPPPPPPPPPPKRPPRPAAPSVAPRADGPDGAGLVGFDISHPQCGKDLPAPGAFGIVGVSKGRAFKRNPCLAEQWRWAKASGRAGVYVNINFPKVDWELEAGATGPQPDCAGQLACVGFNFGFNGIQDALAHARASGVDAHFWWLDVETMNYWTDDAALNAVVITGAIEALRGAGKDIGIYSTDFQWRKIAGAFRPGLPVWIAGAPTLERAGEWCRRTFGGGTAVLVQVIPTRFDENKVCEGAGPIGRYFA